MARTPAAPATHAAEQGRPERSAKALEAAIAQVERAFGKGSLMRLGDRAAMEVETVSTGSLGLDIALGVGGLPKGRIIEIYGPEASGKTSIALHSIAESQRGGGTCAFIDAEHALDPAYAAKLGVDVEKLLISQPDNGEQALEIADVLARSGAVDLIVVDSVAALTPKAEIEGEMGDNHVGLHARLMSQALRKLTGNISRSKATVIFINQLRCIGEDSLVCTNEGLLPIKSIDVGMKVATPLGMSLVKGVHHAGEVAGSRLRARYRPSISVAYGHRQTMLEPGHGLREFLAEDIQPGMWMAYPISTDSVFPEHNPGGLSLSEAAFLGMFFADGSCVRSGTRGGRKGTNFLSFTEHSKERRDLVARSMTGLFGADLVRMKNVRVYINGSAAVKRVEEMGTYIPETRIKVIPSSVLQGSRAVVREFLRHAAFDTHGFGKDGFVWTLNTPEQAETVAVLLLRFGVFADVRRNRKGEFSHLYITGEDARLYGEIIGFGEEWKTRACMEVSVEDGARGKVDVVPVEQAIRIRDMSKGVKGVTKLPHYGAIHMCIHKGLNVSRKRLLEYALSALQGGASGLQEEVRLLAKHRFFPVESVEEMKFRAVDIEVEGGRFIANGTLTHNSKIGVMFGNPETTTGGNALKFYASVRLDIRRIGQVKDGDEVKGHIARVKVVKNKMAPPFRQVEFEITYGKGISLSGEVVDLGVKAGIIEKSGAWFSCDGQRIGQGREKAKQFLEDNPEMLRSIVERIKGRTDVVPVATPSENEDEDGDD